MTRADLLAALERDGLSAIDGFHRVTIYMGIPVFHEWDFRRLTGNPKHAIVAAITGWRGAANPNHHSAVTGRLALAGIEIDGRPPLHIIKEWLR